MQNRDQSGNFNEADKQPKDSIQDTFDEIKTTIEKAIENLFTNGNLPNDGSTKVYKNAFDAIQSAFTENEGMINGTLDAIGVSIDENSQGALEHLINLVNNSYQCMQSTVNSLLKALFSNGYQNPTSTTMRKHISDQIQHIFQRNKLSIKMAFETFNSNRSSIEDSNNFELISNQTSEIFRENGQIIRDTLQRVNSADAQKNLNTVIHKALDGTEQAIIGKFQEIISIEYNDSYVVDEIVDAITNGFEQNERVVFNAMEKLIENEDSVGIPCESVKKLSDALIIAFKIIEINVYHSLEVIIMHSDIDFDWKIYDLRRIAVELMDESSIRIENVAYGDFEENFNNMMNKISKFHDKIVDFE